VPLVSRAVVVGEHRQLAVAVRIAETKLDGKAIQLRLGKRVCAVARHIALCVRGVARLISSANKTCAKTGPSVNSNCRVCWLKMVKPVMSPGSRSGVHCTRANCPPTACASALARVVLPSPGRSSMSKCPLANKQARTSSMTSCLPRKALFKASRSPSISG